jgi:SAM-dependent methyltransferase
VSARPVPAGQTLERLATFLHAEWGDLLFPNPRVDPLCGRFYRTVADLVAESPACDAARVCDVGGGAGRFLFELSRRGIGRTQLVLIEPAGPLCTWARRLLCGEPFDQQVPVVTAAETVQWRQVTEVDLPDPRPTAEVRQGRATDLAAAGTGFDVVACLNVLDRVPQPTALVADLSAALRPGGVLVLSSPLQFRADLTDPADRVTDLRQVLPEHTWNIRADLPSVPYEFRLNDRGRLRLDSQVVLAVKQAVSKAAVQAVDVRGFRRSLGR